MKLRKVLACAISGVMLLGASSSVFADASVKYTISEPDPQGIIYVYNEGGETLGYNKDSGVTIIEKDGYAFKDLNQNSTLDPYEDWRLTTEERAKNLGEIMASDGTEGIEAIAGLMLYSAHQRNIEEELTDEQKTFLEEDNLRHVLVVSLTSTEAGVKWSNNVQAFVEGLGYGIPANNSSDPRHSVGTSSVEYYVGNTGNISLWPSSIGMTATFDPDLEEEFGEIASDEYRALGIATALSPQVDLSTDPRWSRVSGTFGEESVLATDMAQAYVNGFQTTYDENGNDVGWGTGSVNAMVKHWPGGGTGEAGRDAHYDYGKFAVFPGDNFDEHLLPFTEGAFKLTGSTGSASAVMPYYTISYDQDDVYGENVGNSYSRYIISDLLRGEYNYDGVVCTDWGITKDCTGVGDRSGRPWGVEDLTVAERHYKILLAGVDQFGGNNDKGPIMEAYDMMVADYGQSYADNRFAESARRLLTNIFNAGLFENPYLDVEESVDTVGNSDYMTAGYEAQLKSVVMTKNNDNIISSSGLGGKKVYVADFETSGDNQGNMSDDNKTFYSNYLGDQFVDNTGEADVAIVVMSAPSAGAGYSTDDVEAGGNGYLPMSLQYSAYTATAAREKSLAANSGVPYDDVDNRSYKDKTYSNETNEYILSVLEDTKEAMGDKPVIVYMKQTNPMVWSEVEPLADAIVIGYSIQTQAAMEIITGEVEPTGMLPMQQPASMDTVEKQYEDVAMDMECYVDANGNTYDFGFGLCWSGEIGVDTKDARFDTYVAKYRAVDPGTSSTASTTSTDSSTESAASTDSTASTTSTVSTTGSTTTPKTGDYNLIFVMGALIMVGGIVLAVSIKRRYGRTR